MRIENGTAYETRALRSIVCAVHVDLARREGRRLYQWARLRVVVKHSQGGHVSGCAWLGGSPCILRLPKAGRPWQSWTIHADGTRTQYQEPPVAVLQVVLLVAHELLHSYGYGHHQFTDPFKTPDEWREFAAGLGLGERLAVAAPRVKPKRDVRGERYARVLERERIWQRKAKLAATKLKQLRGQRRYYERANGGAPS